MTYTIAVANKKGGAGKTPTSVHLSFALSKAGNKVLYVDADSQGSGSFHLIGDAYRKLKETLFDAISEPKEPMRIEPYVVSQTLHMLPSSGQLDDVEVTLMRKKEYFYQVQLRKLLLKYPDYDFVVVDTPGYSAGVLTIISLAAANVVIIPTATQVGHYDPTLETYGVIEGIRDGGLNPNLKIWGLVLNQLRSNVLHDREIMEAFKARFKDLVYCEPSRMTNKYADAMSMHVDIRELDPVLGKYWDAIATSVVKKARE